MMTRSLQISPSRTGAVRAARRAVAAFAGMIVTSAAVAAPAQVLDQSAPATATLAPVTIAPLPGAAGSAWQGFGAGAIDAALAVPFPLVGDQLPAQDLLDRLSARSPLPLVFPGKLRGTVDLRNADGTLGDALAQIESQLGLMHWTDGVVIHLEDRQSIASRVVPAAGLAPDRLGGQLATLGLHDPRFPVTPLPEAGMLRIVGPEGYVAAVTEALGQIAAERRRALAELGAPIPEGLDTGAALFDLPDAEQLPNIIRGRGRSTITAQSPTTPVTSSVTPTERPN